MRFSIHIALVLAVASTRVSAQERADDPLPRLELTPFVAAARHSPVGTHWGVSPNRNHLFIGIHATARVARTRRWSFAYAPEVVPLLIVTNNPKYVTETFQTFRGPQKVTFEQGTGPVIGFAIEPIGIESDVRVTRRLRAYGAGGFGCVWFTRQVPVLDSRAFNFTFEFGGGLEVQLREGRWLRAGYKFHHLSNLYTARQNPGIDANAIVVGLGFVVRHSGRDRSR